MTPNRPRVALATMAVTTLSGIAVGTNSRSDKAPLLATTAWHGMSQADAIARAQAAPEDVFAALKIAGAYADEVLLRAVERGPSEPTPEELAVGAFACTIEMCETVARAGRPARGARGFCERVRALSDDEDAILRFLQDQPDLVARWTGDAGDVGAYWLSTMPTGLPEARERALQGAVNEEVVYPELAAAAVKQLAPTGGK